MASGIVNNWTAAAGRVAESFHHREGLPRPLPAGYRRRPPRAHQLYRKPIDALNDYLDKLDEYGVPKSRRVVAAIGPQMLKLSARLSAGAHPYSTRPVHTAQARELIGPEAFLAPEHKVVPISDTDEARAVGRETHELYLNLTNALNSWKRMGFTDEDVAEPGSDRLVDAVAAHGTTDAIAARLKQHLDAGADHLPLQADMKALIVER